jgi:hypothetical protein
MFVDIRVSRSVRAIGFRSDAFEKALGSGRYHHFPRLGNARVKSHQRGIKIVDASAAKDLLKLASEYARDNRRIIFFCACKWPKGCHRHTVAELLLKEADRIGRRIEVVEWPGGAAANEALKVKELVFKAVSRGSKSIPLDDGAVPPALAYLPWGSILKIVSNGQSLPVLTGPAKYSGGRWVLPICEQSEPGAVITRLRGLAEEFRERKGLQPMKSS